jgi:riboflavin synthase
MFTGIVQGTASVQSITDRTGLRSLALSFPPGFGEGLAIGASVAVDGVCLTVTQIRDPQSGSFDVIRQTLSLTTLGSLTAGSRVNVERAAQVGAEVGGHPLSGHIDFTATIVELRRSSNNRMLRIGISAPWMRYLFAKGYVAINGASLTVAEAHREPDGAGWVEVWLIPETLRATTYGDKKKNDLVNVEVDRQTQIFVDTVRDAVQERLDTLMTDLKPSMKHSVAASIQRGSHQYLPGASLSIGGLGKMATKKKGKSRKLKPRDGGQGQGPHAMKPRDGGQGQGPHSKSPRKKK